MRTDANGREVAPARSGNYSFHALLKPFLTGAAIGIGFCLVMGPGLLLLDRGVSQASQSPVVARLSRDWPVWRDRLLAGPLTRAFAAERHDDEALLRHKWRRLQDALTSTVASNIVLQ